MSRSNQAATAEKIYTPEEYLAFEREAEEKHEFVDGEIVAMAGATREHNLIGVNISSELRFGLKGSKCEVYANDMRVRMRNRRYGYPDVVVVCGKPQFDDDEFDVLLNPTVVVEVLSKSTRFRDKTEKLIAYQKMESLRECLLVEQIESRVEHYIKQTSKQWLLKIYEDLDETVFLESINCHLPLAEIYAQIEFENITEE
ncbi:MAG: Uma2 family endonuclease [Pyrinomonadaceae bacterium]|nr:Uma2 family endonuclease [Pyrinomonadaceae bacterium]